MIPQPITRAAALSILLAIGGLACAPRQPEAVEPPKAAVIPHELTAHGDTRTDPYYWLKERDNPEVVAYLEAENAYTEAVMKPTEELQETLYQEIVGRIEPDDTSVPVRRDEYEYYRRFEEGGEYPIHCRRRVAPEAAGAGNAGGSAPEEIMLDVNELAEGHEFFSARGLEVSFGQQLLAYATDSVGRRIYTQRFRDLATGEDLPDVIERVSGNSAWANDDKTLFYTRPHPETLRRYQVWRHVLGSDPAGDELIYEEADETFSVAVFKSKSKRYLMIASFQTLATEFRYLPADEPEGEFRVFEPRRKGHEYSVDHWGDHFYIRTNDEAKNFRLMKTPVAATGRESWQEVIPHRDDVFLNGFEIFRDQLVLSERREGLIHLRIRPWDGSEEHELDFGEPAYLAYIGPNPEFDTPVLRYGYTSMTTPDSVYDYDMTTREKTLRKRDVVLGDFDPASYRTERLHATARDGTRVPISLVHRVGTPHDGTSPLLLYGYGSYGASLDATFSAPRLSLLDRGFVFAIAHVRGGQELGRQWYEDGKLLEKMNTFTDFIDCAEFLIAAGWADPDRLYAMGGSAGGLLMGAVTNLRPDLFHGVVSHVPFVDVVTTMLDPDIPLTTGEYDEWGDPDEKEYYDYMLSYSPYDQIEAKEYPHLLVTTGLHDSQVQYWEPAKYVAKLRATKTGDSLLLLQTNMEAGHGGASGRFKQHRETALDYAFLLHLAGLDGGS